jgi:hypothetical protein
VTQPPTGTADLGPQAAALRPLVQAALVRQQWLGGPSDPRAESDWAAEQVDLVALEALRAFPGRDWASSSSPDDLFDEFIDLALMNRQSNRENSFANSAELFLAGHRGREYRAGYYDPPLGVRSAYVIAIYGLCLAATAPIAAFIAAMMLSSAIKKGTALASNRDFQDFVNLITSCALFLPLAYLSSRVRVLRATPRIITSYLPIVLLVAFGVFVEFRLVYELVIAKQMALSFSVRQSLGSLLQDARDRWLYSGTFVVISLVLLQYSGLIGRLLPEEIELSDELASFLMTVIVTVIAVAVSAVIKVLLIVVS